MNMNMTQDQAIEVIRQYTELFNLNSEQEVIDATQLLMANPDNVYEGPMYRTVYLPYDVVSKFKTVDQLNQYLIDNARDVSSWSKSIDGMTNAVYHLIDGECIEHNGGIVICRTGQALDCEKVYEHCWHDGPEEELLCNSRVQDFTIHAFTLGCDQMSHAIDQYDRFLMDLVQLELDDEEQAYTAYVKNITG